MQKNFYKKTIALTYLAIFLFGFFVPIQQSSAQSTERYLELKTDKTTIEKNTKIKITAFFPKKEDRHSNTTINFFSIPELTGFNNKANCTIGINEIWSCYVELESSIAENYTIYGIYNYFNDKKFKTKPITIKVEGEPIITTPTNIITPTETKYTLLAPLPNFTEINTAPSKDNPCPFGNYLNIMIRLIIGICAVLAMIMIVMGGIEYMTSELISSKEEGKERILHAILGLVIALGAYTILNTINPQLLNACLGDLPKAEITITPEQELTIQNRSGGGKCEIITDTTKSGYPGTIEKIGFKSSTTANEPFKKLSAQASAISKLESSGSSDKLSSMDICSDNKSFSIGLFQINAIAHRNEIAACKNAFTIPVGHGNGQGNPVEYVTNKNGQKYVSKWSCKTVEPAYTNCKNFLTNPTNNIKFAEGSTLYGKNKWQQWSTYASCKNKF